MADRFDQFRLTLLARAQIDAFEDPNPTREEYLRKVFSQPWQFQHYGNTIHFTPDAERSGTEALFGMIGRGALIDENLPPEEGLKPAPHQGWLALVLAIDPRDHVDGQKAAIEYRKQIGGPIALMTALVGAINEGLPHTAYHMEVQPVFDAQSFWDFAEANRGDVTSVTFDLVAPNGLWTARTNIKTELAKLKADTKTEEVITTFRSEQGIETNSEQIKQAVQYAEGGSGRIRAKTRRGKRFSSTEKPKTAILDESHPPNEPLIVRAAKHIAKVFARE